MPSLAQQSKSFFFKRIMFCLYLFQNVFFFSEEKIICLLTSHDVSDVLMLFKSVPLFCLVDGIKVTVSHHWGSD